MYSSHCIVLSGVHCACMLDLDNLGLHSGFMAFQLFEMYITWIEFKYFIKYFTHIETVLFTR